MRAAGILSLALALAPPGFAARAESSRREPTLLRSENGWHAKQRSAVRVGQSGAPPDAAAQKARAQAQVAGQQEQREEKAQLKAQRPSDASNLEPPPDELPAADRLPAARPDEQPAQPAAAPDSATPAAKAAPTNPAPPAPTPPRTRRRARHPKARPAPANDAGGARAF